MVEKTFRRFALMQKGKQKLPGSVIYAVGMGIPYVGAAKRSETRGDGVRKLQFDLFFNKNVAPTQNYGNSDVNSIP